MTILFIRQTARYTPMLLSLVMCLISGCDIHGCDRNTGVYLRAEVTARRLNGEIDVTVYMDYGAATPSTVLMFVPIDKDWIVAPMPEVEEAGENTLATLARHHQEQGFQIKGLWHEALDERPDSGCLAIAVFRPEGAETLAAGPLCQFSLAPAEPGIVPDYITLELPAADAPVSVNQQRLAASAAAHDGSPIHVSTTTRTMTTYAPFAILRRLLPRLSCR